MKTQTAYLLVVGFLLIGKGMAQRVRGRILGLFSECSPIRLIVGELNPDARKIGLTEESIRAAVESRLRSARLYSSEATNWLFVNVHVLDNFYSLDMDYQKLVHDPASNQLGFADTWTMPCGIGGHGGDAGHILSSISCHTCPLPSWATSRVVFQHRTTVLA